MVIITIVVVVMVVAMVVMVMRVIVGTMVSVEHRAVGMMTVPRVGHIDILRILVALVRNVYRVGSTVRIDIWVFVGVIRFWLFQITSIVQEVLTIIGIDVIMWDRTRQRVRVIGRVTMPVVADMVSMVARRMIVLDSMPMSRCNLMMVMLAVRSMVGTVSMV